MRDQNNQTLRRAARTVILDGETGKIAVIEARGGDYHKIPGGGIDEGETPEQAAIREAKEEAGCDVELVKKIGELDFVDSKKPELIHHSICYLARVTSEIGEPSFDDGEKKRNFRLLWLDINEALSLFKNPKTKSLSDLKMNNRDMEFVKIAKGYLF